MELVVDPDRVLSPAIARQRFKAVTRGRRQVGKRVCGVEITQFTARYLDEIGWKALWRVAVEDGFSGLAAETSNHGFMYHEMIHWSTDRTNK
jgi:hypothetical protein